MNVIKTSLIILTFSNPFLAVALEKNLTREAFKTLESGVTLHCEAESDEDLACKDLAHFTCTPGTFNDGTGSITDFSILNSTVSKVADEGKKQVKEKYLKTLQDPKESTFRSQAQRAVAKESIPECYEKEKHNLCNDKLANILTSLSLKKHFQGEDWGTFSTGPLEELSKLNSDETFKKIQVETKTLVFDSLKNNKLGERLEKKIFPEVQSLLKAIISSKVSNTEMREKLLQRVSSIKFGSLNCGVPDEYVSVETLIVPNGFYDPRMKTVNICNGLLLTGDSDFRYAQIIAHEMAHSIDPCGIADENPTPILSYKESKNLQEIEQEYPFSNLISCLRSNESIKAARLVPQGVIGNSSSPFCQDEDQIGEAFADWAAAQIVPKYISTNFPNLTKDQARTGYANIFRGLCSLDVPEFEGDSHPSIRSRVNKLILADPLARIQMQCSAKLEGLKTCDVEQKGNK